MFTLIWTIVSFSLGYTYLTLGKKGLSVQSWDTIIFSPLKLLPEICGLLGHSIRYLLCMDLLVMDLTWTQFLENCSSVRMCHVLSLPRRSIQTLE